MLPLAWESVRNFELCDRWNGRWKEAG